MGASRTPSGFWTGAFAAVLLSTGVVGEKPQRAMVGGERSVGIARRSNPSAQLGQLVAEASGVQQGHQPVCPLAPENTESQS